MIFVVNADFTISKEKSFEIVFIKAAPSYSATRNYTLVPFTGYSPNHVQYKETTNPASRYGSSRADLHV